MDNPILATIASFLAMVMVVLAYFVKKKSVYLTFQASCIVFLIFSYFFSLQFFAMIGLTIGLCRTLVFFVYEKYNKRAPIWLSFLLGGMTVASYFIVNLGILHTAKPLDILCLVALVMYAFIFRIRNLKIVRFTMLVPTVLSILYNALTFAPIFSCCTYIFELVANVISILKYHVFGEKKRAEIALKENTYEIN